MRRLFVLIAFLAVSCGGRSEPVQQPTAQQQQQQAREALADAGAEASPLVDAPAGDYWTRVRTVVGPNEQSNAIVVAGRLCFGGAKPPRVVCQTLGANGRATEIPLSESKDPLRGSALATTNGLVYQVHALPGRLLVHELDVANTRMLRRMELPLPGAGDRRARVLFADGGKLFIASGGPTVVVDIARGEIVGKLELASIHEESLGSPLFVGREDNAPVGVRVNPADGKTLWKHTGKKNQYLDGITEWGKRVALLDSDGKLSVLDGERGKVLAEKRIAKTDKRAGSVPPLADGEDLFVVADRLYRLNGALGIAAQVELPEYLFGNLLLVGDALLAASRRSIFVLDRHTLTVRHKLENREDWQFSGQLVRAPEGVIAIDELRYNSEISTHFLHLRPVATGRLDRAALPADAVVYLDGKPLADPGRVPHGDHVLDLLRVGHRPTSTKARIEAGKTTTLAAVDWKPLAPPAARSSRLPKGVQLSKLLAATPRRVAYPATFAAYISVTGGDRQASFSEKTGLQLLDARSGKVVAKRSFADTLSDLDPTVLARFQDKSRRPPGIALPLLSPEAGLLFVSTEGDLQTQLAAFDASTGQRRWSQRMSLPLPVMSSKGGGYFTSTFWVAHGLLWHRDGHTLYARDLATGRLVLERYDAAEDFTSELLFTNDSVIFLQNERVQRLQLFTGKVLWSLPVPKPAELYLGPGATEIVVVAEASVRRISLDGKVLASSGALAGHIDDNPALIDDEYVFVCGHFRNRVYALRRKDLSQAWSYFEKSGASPCPLAADDRDLLLGDGGTRLLVDKKTGKVQQKLPASDLPDRLTPVIGSGSELCFPSNDATLCVRP